MTIVEMSAISAKPLLDEGRHFHPARSSPGVCKMEGNVAATQQATLAISKGPSTEGLIATSEHLSCEGSRPPSPRLAFVYGTLKRGFGNHWLMEELLAGAHARFVGFACTKRRFPLVCGPFQVPFLLPSPFPSGHHVRGELYEVDSFAIARLDELEGVSKGHYERHPIDIILIPRTPDVDALTHHKKSEMHPSDMHTHDVDGDSDPSHADLDTSCCTLTEPLSSFRLYMDPPYLDEMRTSTTKSKDSGPSEYLRAEVYFACPSYGLQMADRAPHIPCYTEKEASTYVRRKDRPNGRTFLEHIHAWIEENGLIQA